MSINAQIHSKIIAHAGKYPECAINGILIGRLDDKNVELVGLISLMVLTDAIPVQHLWNKLSPVLEMALQLVEIHAKSLNLQIVGLYEASELIDQHPTLSSTTTHILNKIKSNANNSKHVVGIAVDNRIILKDSKEAGLLTFKPSQSQSFTSYTSTISPVDMPKIKTLCSHFNDFDDHLENNSLDWLNNKGFTSKL
ncbi:UPF0172-domain-containing protein [Wallemia mellicola]|uniref:UPF0172-domain-containing protein n=1 Tax=Wallemia mellicola TaxID=1708541 RepID=A0AB74KHT5_9BASI|nr:UPF0172-domain-containing protein [Wallemia mellicola]TIB92405.1 UPF0172-domain-containing protein [Wallemia mellicola]TIC07855.1 UPF0172-domain-containing protein [Wallemia mellicola]TIC15409.1 UPF0172-domain-containing protein [Wallemia mellicola]TIC26139.1 UPF0172-domain-containing protein [Wallemia mellicola]